jgi:hypothetical protein
VDVYGKLPLHYVADRVEPNLAAIQCLLQAYPQGAICIAPDAVLLGVDVLFSGIASSDVQLNALQVLLSGTPTKGLPSSWLSNKAAQILE